jgi:hypothetical protein
MVVQGRSCTMQLSTMVNKWTENPDDSRVADAVSFDFAKAFDPINLRDKRDMEWGSTFEMD